MAQDIAVAPMLVFAQSAADVFQQWPLLLVRVVIALLILAALLIWVGKTARQRLQMAMLLEGNVELAILFSFGICFLAASVTGYIGLSPVFCAFFAGLALCPYKFTQNPSWMGAFNHWRRPTGRALVSSLVTPQIGEFSFVLTTSGVALGIFRVLKQISCWR